MRRSLFVAAGATLAASATLAAPLSAQGSSVMTHGSCATALAGAQVAAPCEDGSAVLFNPAGLATQGSTIGIGWTGITTSADFTYDLTGEVFSRDESTSSVPFGFASYRVNDRLAVGFGAFAPYGLRIDWPLGFEGRFTSYDTELKNIYLQPTVAYRLLPNLSVGAGLDYVLASIELNQRLDLATTAVPGSPVPGATFGNFGVPLGTDFADARLEGDGHGVGFHLGAKFDVSDRFSIGARYLSEIEIDYDGDADFTQEMTGLLLPPGNPFGAPAGTPIDDILAAQFQAGAPLADQGIATSLTLPSQLVVGFSALPLDALRVWADYQRTTWSSFDQADIEFEAAPTSALVLDYQDTDTWRFGAEVSALDALALRAGYIYNTAAEKDFSVSPFLPEAERNYYSLGFGYRFGESLGLDVGYQLVDQDSRRGRVRGRAPGLTEAELEALNVGVYDVEASVLNVTLSYRLGGR